MGVDQVKAHTKLTIHVIIKDYTSSIAINTVLSLHISRSSPTENS